jgi:TRAP-type C4-dicarboxylate transport system permease small subunit
MLSIYNTIKMGLLNFLKFCVFLVMGILVVDVIWQVFTRFVLNDPSSWTEELAIMLLIWVSMLGAAVVFQEKGHLGVDYFVEKASPQNRLWVEGLVQILILFFAVSLLVVGGSQLAFRVMENQQLSPALGVNMGYVYLVVPVSGLFIVLFVSGEIVKVINQILKSRLS